MDWQQIALLVAAALTMLFTTGKLDWRALLAKLFTGGKVDVPAVPADPTTRRVLLALELRAACDGACPEAVKLLDAAFPHLLPGHVEGKG